MKIAIGLIAGLLLTQSAPALAQYHYNYGDSRVVNQNQTGLYTPSATYIGAGTMSRSAQGKGAGIGGALPAVNMGAHVRTPGDNMYNGDGSDRQGNGAFIYKDQEERMAAETRMKAQRQQMIFMRQQQARMQQQATGNVYMPGSNGAAASYGSAPTAPVIFRNGAASYGDNYSGKGGGTRQF